MNWGAVIISCVFIGVILLIMGGICAAVSSAVSWIKYKWGEKDRMRAYEAAEAERQFQLQYPEAYRHRELLRMDKERHEAAMAIAKQQAAEQARQAAEQARLAEEREKEERNAGLLLGFGRIVGWW